MMSYAMQQRNQRLDELLRWAQEQETQYGIERRLKQEAMVRFGASARTASDYSKTIVMMLQDKKVSQKVLSTEPSS